MILVDTSIWVDFIRSGEATLSELLRSRQVLVHPFVIGELSVGNLRDRERVLDDLLLMPSSAIATHSEALWFINDHRLYGLGIGYVDCHLLASTMLTPGAYIWTRDKRLKLVARQLGIAAPLPENANGNRP